jgi:antirestriction protein ArdC
MAMSNVQIASKMSDTYWNLMNEGELPPWRKPWSVNGLYGCNLQNPTKPYRGMNQMITAVQPFEQPYWLAIGGIKKLGGRIRKGEKSIQIYFCRWLRKDKQPMDDSTVVYRDCFPIYKYYNIWNVEQIDGIEAHIPKLEAPTAEFSPIERAEAIIANLPDPCKVEHRGGSCHYIPASDTIVMAARERFENEMAYYATFFHEQGHASGHKSRLARKGVMDVGMFGSCDYSTEELIAEMASGILCGRAGIDMPTLDNRAAYIKGWMKKLKNDKRALMSAALAATKAAAYMLNEQPAKTTTGAKAKAEAVA